MVPDEIKLQPVEKLNPPKEKREIKDIIFPTEE